MGSHSHLFTQVTSGKRDQTARTVLSPEVSLGMVDPSTGRSLLYHLLTLVTNGDKVVLAKLDSCVSTSCDDVDDDDFSVVVDHKCLVDEDPRSLVLVKDLMNLPRKRTSPILSHPVITTFIEKKWLRTRWLFLLSFTFYLIFVLLFSTFLWMMYERNNSDEIIRIPVELPQTCDALRPINFSNKGNGINSRFNDEPKLIDVTAQREETDLLTTRAGVTKKTPKGRNDDDYKIKLEVIKEKKNKTKMSRVRRKEGLFRECSSKRRKDIP